MATSPIYGWAEPDNTDLVKNGALAIRTLGNAIDTTMGTMTPKSTYTAKGSIAAATAASTPANLAVGNNGEVLVPDSSTATGLRYQATQAAGRNIVINGGFDFWQRGTTIGSWLNGITTADRWYLNATASTLYAQDAVNVAGGCRYSIKATVGAGASTVQFLSAIETSNALSFANQTSVFSAYVATSTSANVELMVQYSNSVDESVIGTWTTAYTSTVATTTTLTRKEVTGTIPSTAKSIRVRVSSSGNLAAAATMNVTGVQLQLGSIATTFTRTGGTIQGELEACQRYYQNYIRQGTVAVGQAYSTSAVYATFQYVVPMRVSATVTLGVVGSGSGQISFLTSSAGYPATMGSVAAGAGSVNGFEIQGTGFTAAFVVGNASMYYANGITSIYAASAEL